MKKQDQITKDFGECLKSVLTEAFNDSAWYEVNYKRNESEVKNFLEMMTVMSCCGYNENFYPQALLKLDLYKLKEYNPIYKKAVSKLKNRYCIFDVKYFFGETLGGLVAWDLDVTSYLIKELIKRNSK